MLKAHPLWFWNHGSRCAAVRHFGFRQLFCASPTALWESAVSVASVLQDLGGSSSSFGYFSLTVLWIRKTRTYYSFGFPPAIHQFSRNIRTQLFSFLLLLAHVCPCVQCPWQHYYYYYKIPFPVFLHSIFKYKREIHFKGAVTQNSFTGSKKETAWTRP